MFNFIVVQFLSRVWLFAIPWTAAHQACLSFTISWSLLKRKSIESVMPSNHLILCHPFSSCPQSFPGSGSLPMNHISASGSQSIRASASVLSNEYSGLISFRINRFDLLAVQGTLNSLLQHHNLKASLRCLRCLQDRCPTTEGSFWVLGKKSYPCPEIPLCDPWLSQNASFEEEESSVSGSTLRMAAGCEVAPRALSSEF